MKDIKLKPIAELMNKVCKTNINLDNLSDDLVLKVDEKGDMKIE